jgi:hypothetical protein
MFLLTLCCTLLFFGEEYYATKKLKINLDTLNKINSSFHALAMVLGSFYYLIDLIDQDKLNYYLYLSSGFAIYDIINLFNMNYRHKYSLTFHHLMIIYGNTYCMLEQDDDLYYILAINYLSEISTYFLNNVLYLYEEKQTDTNFFKYNCYALMITYLFFRIFVDIYSIIYMLSNNCNYLLLQLSMTTMNFIWFSKLIKKYQRMKNKNLKVE